MPVVAQGLDPCMDFLKAFRPIAADMASTLTFVVLFWATGNVAIAAGVGVAVGIAQFAYRKLRGQPVGPLQYVSLVLVVVTGAATILTHDPHFVMIKSSFVSFAVGTVMLTTRWQYPYLPQIVRDNLPDATIRVFERAWGVLLYALAIANFIVALSFSTDAWAWYAAVVPNVALVVAFAIQYKVIRALVARTIGAREAAVATG